ncbi:hypothetical protein DL96DRAFT_1688658 [Flagelloscypha sp. PMI_526]|nr:hypothetical protein DL96DRAFT_1688658 [Flagelloscypha sp. PMI_526]
MEKTFEFKEPTKMRERVFSIEEGIACFQKQCPIEWKACRHFGMLAKDSRRIHFKQKREDTGANLSRNVMGVNHCSFARTGTGRNFNSTFHVAYNGILSFDAVEALHEFFCTRLHSFISFHGLTAVLYQQFQTLRQRIGCKTPTDVLVRVLDEMGIGSDITRTDPDSGFLLQTKLRLNMPARFAFSSSFSMGILAIAQKQISHDSDFFKVTLCPQ